MKFKVKKCPKHYLLLKEYLFWTLKLFFVTVIAGHSEESTLNFRVNGKLPDTRYLLGFFLPVESM